MRNVAERLVFLKGLQGVTNKIHATSNIDELLLEMSQDICQLFSAERLTIYVTSEDRQSIISRVKTGLNAFRDIRLPINERSIAGYVAATRQAVNLRDVYDAAELRRYSERMQFLQDVDRQTGYRSKQMLVVPIIDAANHLRGVVQLINQRQDQPFGDFHEEGARALAETLAVALMQRGKPPFLARSKYEQLVETGIVSPEELLAALQEARAKGISPETILVKSHAVTPGAIGAALAKFFAVPYEPFKPDRIKPVDLLQHIKRDYVDENYWLPLDESPEGLVILAPDPERVRISRMVHNIFPKSKIVFRVTTAQEFAATVDQFFGAISNIGSVDELLSSLDDPAEASGESGEDLSAAADNELVRLVNKIIVDAYQQGASDIHIEPRAGKEKTLVRFRKDGALVNYIEVPAGYRAALVTRLKIMCDLDIAEKRKPQDGKIRFKKYGPLDIELRVATLPTAGGVEDVVMRILAAGEPIKLDQLGLSEHNHRHLLGCIEKPYGLFFVCGPTGSGKTTTLHSVLGYLNRPETKIWTAEDPVEITQKGLRQVQINKKAGLDFATTMKAFLRADPDIIMVGEMRDAETTGIGIEASLTGHLVFATLHTNSAPESIIRLLDMGMDPFNFADALLGILAQRLARRFCSQCRETYHAEPAEIERLLDEYCAELAHTQAWQRNPMAARAAIADEWRVRFAQDGHFVLGRPRGCPHCNDTGYKGRIGLHELLVGSDTVKQRIQEKARVAEILACALEEGMRTLKMDGIEKVLQGDTDLKQVRTVCIK